MTEGSPGIRPMITALPRINVEGGDVLRGLRASDQGFDGFGEAYFSFIETGVIKSWRRHRVATLNLVVPSGKVRFVTTLNGERFEEHLISSDENYARLTIPPGFWMAFQGLANTQSIVLNISSHIHESQRIDKCELNQFDYDW